MITFVKKLLKITIGKFIILTKKGTVGADSIRQPCRERRLRRSQAISEKFLKSQLRRQEGVYNRVVETRFNFSEEAEQRSGRMFFSNEKNVV